MTKYNILPIVPQTIAEAKELSKELYASKIIADQLKSAANVFVAVNISLALGVPPVQGVQNIAIINGKFCMWGDLLLAVVRVSSDFESITETLEGSLKNKDLKAICKIKRKGEEEQTTTFSTEDAITAGLWKYGRAPVFKTYTYNGKTVTKQVKVPWETYPAIMLKNRARGFALRDNFADKMCGLITREEAEDYPTSSHQEKPEPKQTKTPVVSKMETTDTAKTKPPIVNLPKAFNSVLLNDSFTFDKDGGARFISGAYYTREEVEQTKILSDKVKVKIHSEKIAEATTVEEVK